MGGNGPGLIHILVKPKGEPPSGGKRTRHRYTHLGVKMKLNLDQLHGTRQCRPSHFPISLNGVAVTKRKQSALNSNRQIQAAVLHQFFAVKVPSAEPGWKGCLHTLLIRWHPHDAHERSDAERLSPLAVGQSCVGIQGPHGHVISTRHRDHSWWATWCTREAQPVIHLAWQSRPS